MNLLTPQFVQPNRDNPRILKQDGAFIISGLDASDKESDNKIREFLVKELIIPKEAKKQLRKELEYVGMMQLKKFHQNQIEVNPFGCRDLHSVQPTLRHLIDFITVQHQVGCESVMLIKKDVLICANRSFISSAVCKMDSSICRPANATS